MQVEGRSDVVQKIGWEVSHIKVTDGSILLTITGWC